MICAAKGETATADRLQLWEREHSKHRDVHLGELAALQQTAGLTVTAKEAKIVAKMKAQQDMQKKTEAKIRHDAFLGFTDKLPDCTAVPLMGRPDGLSTGAEGSTSWSGGSQPTAGLHGPLQDHRGGRCTRAD